MQGRSESRQRVVAHRRGGREARLARGGIQEHDAFLGDEKRIPSRNWVCWCLDGWGVVRPRFKEGKRGEGPSSLGITAIVFVEFAMYFRFLSR